jgi:hypothetical protein
VDNGQCLRGAGITGPFAIRANLPRPRNRLAAANPSNCPHADRTALAKLDAISRAFRLQPNVRRENIPTAAGKRQIRHFHQPHPGGHGQGIEDGRLTRSVVPGEQGKVRMEFERLARELLEVLNL